MRMMRVILILGVVSIACSVEPIDDGTGTEVGVERTELIGECGGFCGGFGGFPCNDEACGNCIDDPTDDCSPETGGADCGGICVPGPKQKRCFGQCVSACVHGCADSGCGTACVDACHEACDPTPPPPDDGTVCGPFICAPGTAGCNCACNNAQCVPEDFSCAAVCL